MTTVQTAAKLPGKTTKALDNAFSLAANGQTALVVAPNRERIREFLNYLAQHLLTRNFWYCRIDYNTETLYFEGQRGSIRFYTQEHADYDKDKKAMRGYPAGQPCEVLE